MWSRRILGREIQAALLQKTDLFAQLDGTARFAKGRDNRYAADSTMVTVNQGILKIWQDICWLPRVTHGLQCRPLNTALCHPTIGATFRRVMVIAGVYSCGTQVAILRGCLLVFVCFTSSNYIRSLHIVCLTSREKIVNKYGHQISYIR